MGKCDLHGDRTRLIEVELDSQVVIIIRCRFKPLQLQGKSRYTNFLLLNLLCFFILQSLILGEKCDYTNEIE